jgi:hypothetical protein
VTCCSWPAAIRTVDKLANLGILSETTGKKARPELCLSRGRIFHEK